MPILARKDDYKNHLKVFLKAIKDTYLKLQKKENNDKTFVICDLIKNKIEECEVLLVEIR